jgi:hypothetical protein
MEVGDREKINRRDFCIRTVEITQFGRVARDEKRIPPNSFRHLLRYYIFTYKIFLVYYPPLQCQWWNNKRHFYLYRKHFYYRNYKL